MSAADSATPFIGHKVRDFLPQRDLLTYAQAILRVYNLEGRRDNKFKARIKILLHEKGLEAFREEIEAEFAARDRRCANCPAEEVERIARLFRPARRSRRAPPASERVERRRRPRTRSPPSSSPRTSRRTRFLATPSSPFL